VTSNEDNLEEMYLFTVIPWNLFNVVGDSLVFSRSVPS
jgi:hypothetical protein